MAKINYKKIAIKSLTLAAIMENREKIDTEELIEKYPNGFTIDEIEFVTMTKEGGKVDQFWAFHIKGTNKFAFAGLVLGKMFDEWLEAFEGDYEELYNDFNGGDGIMVKLSSGKTKSSKQPITIVEIV